MELTISNDRITVHYNEEFRELYHKYKIYHRSVCELKSLQSNDDNNQYYSNSYYFQKYKVRLKWCSGSYRRDEDLRKKHEFNELWKFKNYFLKKYFLSQWLQKDLAEIICQYDPDYRLSERDRKIHPADYRFKSIDSMKITYQ